MQLDTTMNVLVADDFSTMRAVVHKLLTELGFSEIYEAKDGDEAWAMVQSQDFGLIVCDWNMPGMTGIELLAKMKEDVQLNDIPFILITAEAKMKQILEASRLGCDAYIVKPFDADTLYQKIIEVLR